MDLLSIGTNTEAEAEAEDGIFCDPMQNEMVFVQLLVLMPFKLSKRSWFGDTASDVLFATLLIVYLENIFNAHLHLYFSIVKLLRIHNLLFLIPQNRVLFYLRIIKLIRKILSGHNQFQ